MRFWLIIKHAMLVALVLVSGVWGARTVEGASRSTALSLSTPQVTDLTDASFTITFTTNSEQSAGIEYGTTATALTSMALDDRDVAAGASRPSVASTIHRVTVSGLTNSTTYFYEPLVDGLAQTMGAGQPFQQATAPKLAPQLPFRVHGVVQTATGGIPALGTVMLLGSWRNPDGSTSWPVSVLNQGADASNPSASGYNFAPILLASGGRSPFVPDAGATFTVSASADSQGQLVTGGPAQANQGARITLPPAIVLGQPAPTATSTASTTPTPVSTTASIPPVPASTPTSTAVPLANSPMSTATATPVPSIGAATGTPVPATSTPSGTAAPPTSTWVPTRTPTPLPMSHQTPSGASMPGHIGLKLSASAITVMVGRPITLTVLLTGQPGALAASAITLREGHSVIATRAVLAHASAAAWTLRLPAGVHLIVAYYYQAGVLRSRSGVVRVAVRKYASTISLVVTQKRTAAPGTTMLRVSVSARMGGGRPTGSVLFKDGAHVLKKAPLQGAGVALLTTVLRPGRHNLTATYGGNATLSGSTVKKTLVVQ